MFNLEEILNSKIEDVEFSIVDVETTGLNASYNNIIEIGIVKINNNTIIDSFHSMINPGRDIPGYITSFTGITNDDVYNAPFFEDIAQDILYFFDGSIIAGHNLSFDLSFLKKEFQLAGHILNFHPNLCTLKLARRLYPSLKSRSLNNLSNYLNIFNSKAHRALSDSETTAKVLFKMIDELKEKYDYSITKDIINFQFTPQLNILKKPLNKKLNNDLSILPDAPGIYYFLNSKNEIIYVGKAKSLKERIRSYLSTTAPKKSKKIIQQTKRIKTEVTNSELTALLTEAELIKILNPKHNVQLKSYSNKYFVKIDLSHPFPKVLLTNKFYFDGNDYFGLFISRKKAEKTIELIDKVFMLRECNDKEFNHHRGCYLADIERCTMPCMNENKEIYFDELQKVYEFLSGKNQNALNRLLIKMKKYSEQLKFEKAAEIKELVEEILLLIHKNSLLSESINKANVLIEISGNTNSQSNENPFDYILMLEGKIYIKKYFLKEEDLFDIALDDYFSHTIYTNIFPTKEDLEKMKIILNWTIKNRNKVKFYYLKDFSSKEELFLKLSKFNFQQKNISESIYEIETLVNEMNI